MTHDSTSVRWLTVHDDLLRGLAHDFSNRVATIAAIASILDSARIPDEKLLSGLRVDAERLERLLGQLRQLPRRADAALEPLMPGDCVRSALELFAHHTAYRDITCTVVLGDDVQPVRADPAALQHAVCVALAAAARAGQGRSALRVALTTEGDVVRLHVSADGTTDGVVPDTADWDELAADAAAISWLLAGSHGQGVAHGFGCTIELPTLQASRRAR